MKEINNLIWTRNQLWEGCMYASIVHSIMSAHYPYVSHERSWDGINYSIPGGTITFNNSGCVGVFRTYDSERINKNIKAEEYFEGAPKKIIDLAKEEALLYVLEEVEGEIRPIITTAIWEENGVFQSLDTQSSFMEHGGEVIENLLLEINEVKEILKEEYEMEEKHCDLALSLFKRKIANPTEKIILTSDEIKMIGVDDEFGIQESKMCCEQIGIFWE